MSFEENIPEEAIDEFIDGFFSSLNQTFCQNYAEFKIKQPEDLTNASVKLKKAIDGFPIFFEKDKEEVLECKQFILMLNVIAATANANITVMANEQENNILIAIRAESLHLEGENLQTFALATQICHRFSIVGSGIYFIYEFDS